MEPSQPESDHSADTSQEDSSLDWLRLALSSGAFDFWLDPEEDIYTLEDGLPL